MKLKILVARYRPGLGAKRRTNQGRPIAILRIGVITSRRLGEKVLPPELSGRFALYRKRLLARNSEAEESHLNSLAGP